ncbi:MAG: hypothetical protein J6Z49_05495 [Kiritimatiellae bacterium]|nr:hypothetical protein [Kiritimatiellia bacterium]
MRDTHQLEESELAVLESSCRSFTEQLRALAGRFQAETDALASAWQDSKYMELRARVEPIFAECSKALSVVSDSLTPFISRKRQWAGDRPS